MGGPAKNKVLYVLWTGNAVVCALWCWFIASTHVPTLQRPVPDLRIGFKCGQPLVQTQVCVTIYALSLALDISLLCVTFHATMPGAISRRPRQLVAHTVRSHLHRSEEGDHDHGFAHDLGHGRGLNRIHDWHHGHDSDAGLRDLDSGLAIAPNGVDMAAAGSRMQAPRRFSRHSPAPGPGPTQGTLRSFGKLSFITRRFLTDIIMYFIIAAVIEMFAIVWSVLYLVRKSEYNALRGTILICLHSFLGYVIGASSLPREQIQCPLHK